MHDDFLKLIIHFSEEEGYAFNYDGFAQRDLEEISIENYSGEEII